MIKGKSFALWSKSSPYDKQAYCGTPGGEPWVGCLSLIFERFHLEERSKNESRAKGGAGAERKQSSD